MVKKIEFNATIIILVKAVGVPDDLKMGELALEVESNLGKTFSYVSELMGSVEVYPRIHLKEIVEREMLK